MKKSNFIIRSKVAPDGGSAVVTVLTISGKEASYRIPTERVVKSVINDCSRRPKCH